MEGKMDNLKNENSENDFAAMLAEHEIGRNTLQPGQKARGKIIAVTKDSVFIDLGIKQDGIMDRAEILDADGNETLAQGDEVEGWIVSLSPQGPRISKAMTGAGEAALEDAKTAAIPVEGKIIGPCKGGYQVEVLGKKAFCPGSQMESMPKGAEEQLSGKIMPFLITKVENHGRNVVVSRRALIEREKKESLDKLLQEIKIGDTVDGKVTRLTQFGAFIEIAPSVEGLAHISELSWSRVDNPDEVVSPGDMVRAKLISMENDVKGNLRLGLSPKQAMGDPWETVTDKFHPGDMVEGKVKRLAPFGAFVEIAPGIEGLSHISEFSWEKRVHKPEDMLAVGDMVHVKIKEIDPASRRMSLSIRDAQSNPWEEVEERFAVGSNVMGRVENKSPIGLFVNLAPGITGLLPQNAIKNSPQASKLAKINQGDEIKVIIRSINAPEKKISLGVDNGDNQEVDNTWREHVKNENASADKDMGIMAQAFQKALRNKNRENA